MYAGVDMRRRGFWPMESGPPVSSAGEDDDSEDNDGAADGDETIQSSQQMRTAGAGPASNRRMTYIQQLQQMAQQYPGDAVNGFHPLMMPMLQRSQQRMQMMGYDGGNMADMRGFDPQEAAALQQWQQQMQVMNGAGGRTAGLDRIELARRQGGMGGGFMDLPMSEGLNMTGNAFAGAPGGFNCQTCWDTGSAPECPCGCGGGRRRRRRRDACVVQ